MSLDPVPEPAAGEFTGATAVPPFLYDLPVAEGRARFEEVQAGDVEVARPTSRTGPSPPGLRVRSRCASSARQVPRKLFPSSSTSTVSGGCSAVR